MPLCLPDLLLLTTSELESCGRPTNNSTLAVLLIKLNTVYDRSFFSVEPILWSLYEHFLNIMLVHSVATRGNVATFLRFRLLANHDISLLFM